MYPSILSAIILLGSFSASAKTIKIFNLYRTNYYVEKTKQYAAKVTDACTFESNNPVSVYFIDTKSGKWLENLEGNNKNYFQPKSGDIVQLADTSMEFKFAGLNEVSARASKRYSIGVTLVKNGNSCQAVAELWDNRVAKVKNLKVVNLEYNLVSYPLVSGKHPSKSDPFKWLKAMGQPNYCMLGSCP